MRRLTILHTGDLHYRPDRRAEALASLQTLYEYASTSRPDLIVMAGDLFHRGLPATDDGGYPELLDALRDLLNLAPVVAVQGTPSHDRPGCYAALQKLNAEHDFVLLRPGFAYHLIDDELWIDQSSGRPGDGDLLIFGMGEPQKDHYLADKKGLGRDRTTEAVNAGIRQILAGMGARRRELPDVPALMVYHGTVRGSTMCNGQQVPGGDIAVGRDDLALVGADYYALGHIHLAQEVAGCMVYAGSCYPVDWGECDRKGFWEVGIGGDEEATTYRRINYPHAPRKKIVIELSETVERADIEGVQTWIVVRVRDDDPRPNIDGEKLSMLGAAPGSRVTIEAIPVETVRAGEIREAKSLREKVAVYAENSGEDVAESVLEKADALEADAREAGRGGGLRYRVKSLDLRGATGILKGTGLEEIHLDLDAYDPGLIALVGPNGSGKTTLEENLHPYSTMLTRGGPLQAHFALKDSYRDLRWVDEATGDEYRALIQIDPTLATPKAEYHLWRNGVPLTTGRKDEYDAKIEELLGPLPLYLRSAFVTQKPSKNAPDLADATKGERKELFRALGGLEYLQGYSDEAKERARAKEDEARLDEAKVEVLATAVAETPSVEAARDERRVERDRVKAQAEEIEERGKSLRIEVDALAKRLEEQRAVEKEIEDLTRRDNEIGGELNAAEARIKMARNAVDCGPKAAEIVQKHEDLAKAREALRDEREEYQEGQKALDDEYRERMGAYQTEAAALGADRVAVERRLGSLRGDKRLQVAVVDRLSEETQAPIEETCPTCGQTLPEGQRERLKAEREKNLAALAAAQEDALDIDNRIVEHERQQATAEAKLAALEKPECEEIPPWPQEAAYQRVCGELADIDIENARKVVALAAEARVRIEEGEKRAHDLRNEQSVVLGRLYLAQKRIDTEVDGLYVEKAGELEALRAELTAARERTVEIATEIRGLDARLDELAAKAASLKALQAKIAATRHEAAEWAYLQRACGPDGIQALELDAMGPSITEVANRLLDAAYGSRFRVEIRTTRIAGKGAKTKQVEDFEIVVHDAAGGGEQALDTLSGGETVWIRKALYDSFAIIRARSTGTQFLTAFLDEADGALDPEARGRYFDMILAAHAEGGRTHTVIITHSADAQQAIGQRIEVAGLGAAAREAVAS